MTDVSMYNLILKNLISFFVEYVFDNITCRNMNLPVVLIAVVVSIVYTDGIGVVDPLKIVVAAAIMKNKFMSYVYVYCFRYI